MNDPLNTDLYEVLGIDPDASDKDVSKAYKKLARDLHPDTHPDDPKAEERFKEVTAAYDVLSDADKRAEYDQFRTMVGQGHGGFGPDGGSFNFGGPGGMGPGGMEDLIGRLFGGNGGSLGFRGADVRAKVQLSLDDVMNGAQPAFNLPERGRLEVRVPAGVKDGAKIRVAGRGMAGAQGGPPGDFILEVSVIPHPHFTRKGDDLATKISVPFTTAALGGTAEVEAFGGETVKIKIPAGSQVGRIFRLRGRGVPKGKGSKDEKISISGDLMVELSIEVPTELSDEQHQALEDLRALEDHEDLAAKRPLKN